MNPFVIVNYLYNNHYIIYEIILIGLKKPIYELDLRIYMKWVKRLEASYIG